MTLLAVRIEAVLVIFKPTHRHEALTLEQAEARMARPSTAQPGPGSRLSAMALKGGQNCLLYYLFENFPHVRSYKLPINAAEEGGWDDSNDERADGGAESDEEEKRNVRRPRPADQAAEAPAAPEEEDAQDQDDNVRICLSGQAMLCKSFSLYLATQAGE